MKGALADMLDSARMFRRMRIRMKEMVNTRGRSGEQETQPERHQKDTQAAEPPSCVPPHALASTHMVGHLQGVFQPKGSF
jgi:hypothetical protein